jgi:hypothetical protein
VTVVAALGAATILTSHSRNSFHSARFLTRDQVQLSASLNTPNTLVTEPATWGKHFLFQAHPGETHMTPFHRRQNPFINRMAQDMQIRNLAANTIDAYTWHVDKFCSHFGKLPEELGLEEIRLYQVYLVNEKKASWSSFNQAVCALRFLYEVTLAKPWVIKHIPFGKRPKKLPIVLSDQEALQLLQ